jgi:hypothetical protein
MSQKKKNSAQDGANNSVESDNKAGDQKSPAFLCQFEKAAKMTLNASTMSG